MDDLDDWEPEPMYPYNDFNGDDGNPDDDFDDDTECTYADDQGEIMEDTPW